MTAASRTLDARERRFVDEYIVDLDPRRAAVVAGYSESVAAAKAFGWVGNRRSKPHVYDAVQIALKERSERTEITADRVLREYWLIATADPNELIQHRRVCCRHCYGIGHEYQWIDEAEHKRACAAVSAETPPDAKPVYPSKAGGFGFDPTLSPHAKCPRCFGEGHGTVHATDTRQLSPAAKALYAGVKVTKDGFEIKMNDKMAALAMLAKHVGIGPDKLNVGIEEGNPLDLFLKSLQGTKLACSTFRPVRGNPKD